MNLLIVYSRNEAEILDRKSALGSYIHCLSKAIQEALDVTVYVNGVRTIELASSSSATSETSTVKDVSIKQFIKRLVPRSVKQKISEKKLFSSHQHLLHKLQAGNTKFDHVIEFYTLGSSVGFDLAAMWGIPLHVVYDSPVIEQEEFFKKTRVAHPYLIAQNEKKTLTLAESVIVYSNPVKSYLTDLHSLDKVNFIIHQNVDFSRIDYLPSKKDLSKGINICFLGSFLKWHRVDLLIDIFETISSEFSDAKLHLIGTGMEFEAVREKAIKSRVKSRIFMPGFLDGEELSSYKKNMHIGVMPGSNWYGAPNKIFEYGAAGMAVVSCESPTINDMFSSNVVSFFKMGDQKQFTIEIRKLLTDPNSIGLMATGLQSYIQEKHNIEATVAVYKKILLQQPDDSN